MVSIIICSRTSQLPSELLANIRSTVGTEHEVIAIDNSKGDYNIYQAYNEGVRRATQGGGILCFMHDDIVFLNNGWGKAMLETFQADEKLGAVGVAGGHIMPDCPVSWFACHSVSYHLCQQQADGQYVPVSHSNYDMRPGGIEVACVDGLWMCIRKSLFDTIAFDEQTFDGFHAYDIDICMQVLQAGYTVRVTDAVDIFHKSPGRCDAPFFKAIDLWHRKWHHMLPVARGAAISDEAVSIHQGYARELLAKQKETLMLYDKLHSPEYRLGHFLLKPYRLVKRIATQYSSSLFL